MKRTLPIILSLLTLAYSQSQKPMHNEMAQRYFEEKRAKNGPRVNDDERLYIHLVPHSHDDVGWLKTVEQYYSGTKNSDGMMQNVELILDNVIDQLIDNPARRFT